MPLDNDQQEPLDAAESILLAFEMKTVPLVHATARDQDRVSRSLVSQLGGRIIAAGAKDACSQFLDTVDEPACVFILVQNRFLDDLFLAVRDYMLNREMPLVTRLGSYLIHPDHRLCVLINGRGLANLPVDFRRVLLTLSTVDFASKDSGEPEIAGKNSKDGYQVFESLQQVIEWCDRYYANGPFLFRGQYQDWPLKSPLERCPTKAEGEKAMARTRRFLEWLSQEPELAAVSDDHAKAGALAQHFGLPTRLLDLTKQPRVAAYFASVGQGEEEDALGVLYIFSKYELERHLTFEGESAQKMGEGLVWTEVPGLRRMNHQQGLFVNSKRTLVEGFLLTKLFFKHDKQDILAGEEILLPGTFIFPRPSSIEKKVYDYLLIESATGTALPVDCRAPGQAPTVSFDPGGYAIREFLDETPLATYSPFPSVFSGLDVYSTLLALTSSFLFVFNQAYVSTVDAFGQELLQRHLTAESFSHWRDSLKRLHNALDAPRPTRVPGVPVLSLRDLVDGIAFYHLIRNGNPRADAHQVEAALNDTTRRLWSAYQVAAFFLGDDALRLFGVLGAFAMNCAKPVDAFIEAVRQAGFHSQFDLAEMEYGQAEQLLELWTGHHATSVEEVENQVWVAPWIKTARAQLMAMLREGAPDAAYVGSALFRIGSEDLIQRLGPRFRRLSQGKIAIRPDAASMAGGFNLLEHSRSVLEGMTGVDSTMRCPHSGCPYHPFRICGRASRLPEDYRQCEFGAMLTNTYSLQPEFLRSLKPALSAGQS